MDEFIDRMNILINIGWKEPSLPRKMFKNS